MYNYLSIFPPCLIDIFQFFRYIKATIRRNTGMEDYSAMIRRTFQQGSVLDAQTLFEAFLRNAFPTFHFRRTEVISHGGAQLEPCF